MKYINKFFSLEIIALFLLLLFSIYSYFHIFTDNYFSNYSFSELFINYQAGIIRRGLLGEIFWQYNQLVETNPKQFFGIIFYILYILQIYFLYYICKIYKSSKFFILVIFLAPQLVLFPIYDHKVFFKRYIC